jgi:hypothetical protein
MTVNEDAAWRSAKGKTPTAPSETLGSARHFAKAMIEARRPFEFVLEVMAAYYGNLGREVAIAAFEEAEGNRVKPEGVVPS